MRTHDIFFWVAVFFLTGVLLAGATGDYWAAGAFSLAIAAALYLADKKTLALIAVVALAGVGYYFVYDFYARDRQIVFGQKVQFQGFVRKSENGIKGQKLTVDDILITVPSAPVYDYGDELDVAGTIGEVPDFLRNFYGKEGIYGLMRNPAITRIAKNQGSPVMAALLGIRHFFEDSFQNVLPAKQANFLSGLTLGDTSQFSDDFKEEMQLSGTSHLVALSGFNIAIIVDALGALLGAWWLTRRFNFVICLLFIISFVLMTGAEASVVRAAIMAGIALLARKTGRAYYFRNAIAATALVMVILNPKVLLFDVGFQLSFAALLGIVYLRPLIQKWLKMKEEPGVLMWREHFLNTSSAQLAVLPLLVYQFGFFSPMGIVSNILLLEFIPVTMALGFFIGIAATFSHILSVLVSWPAFTLLSYELGVIHYSALVMKWIVGAL